MELQELRLNGWRVGKSNMQNADRMPLASEVFLFPEKLLAKVKQGTNKSYIGGMSGKESRSVGKGHQYNTLERKCKQKLNPRD